MSPTIVSVCPVNAGWNPWKALRERPHIGFRRVRLPQGVDGLWANRGQRSAILLDSELGRRERSAALAHELVHDERGGGCGCSPIGAEGWRYVCNREEKAVDRIVAERLLDGGEVLAFCSRRADMGEATTASDVAEEFDVATWVAEARLRGLV